MAAAMRDGVATQAVSVLSELFRRAPDPIARRYVLEHPLDALDRAKRRPDEPADPRLGEAGRELLTGLVAIRQVSLRVLRRARDGVGVIPESGVLLLADAANAAETDCAAALSATRLRLSTT